VPPWGAKPRPIWEADRVGPVEPRAPSTPAPRAAPTPPPVRRSSPVAWIAAALAVVLVLGGLGALIIAHPDRPRATSAQVIDFGLEPDQPMPADFKTMSTSHEYEVGIPANWTGETLDMASVDQILAEHPEDKQQKQFVDDLRRLARRGASTAYGPVAGSPLIDLASVVRTRILPHGLTPNADQAVHRYIVDSVPTTMVMIERERLNRHVALHAHYEVKVMSYTVLHDDYFVATGGHVLLLAVTTSATEHGLANKVAHTFVVR